MNETQTKVKQCNSFPSTAWRKTLTFVTIFKDLWKNEDYYKTWPKSSQMLKDYKLQELRVYWFASQRRSFVSIEKCRHTLCKLHTPHTNIK